MTKRAAAGVSVHTGWILVVVAGGSLEAPRVAVRRRAQLLGEKERFLFHAAAEMPLARAGAMVAERTAIARQAVREALEASLEAAREAGEEVSRVAVVGSTRAVPGRLEDVVRSHAIIHAAEGAFYTRLVVTAAEERGLSAEAVSSKDLDRRAMTAFGLGGKALRARLGAVGKQVGPRWTVDEKSAALAAWLALSGRA